jgi:putative glutathione S-transferase
MAVTTIAGPLDVDTHGRYSIPATARLADGTVDYPFAARLGTPTAPEDVGRYHLWVGHTCPWAQRALLALTLRGLEHVVTWSAVDPRRDGRGWAFRNGDDHGPDPVYGFPFLRDAYEATDPGFGGHVSVPTLWDRTEGRIASNHYPTLTADLETRFEREADGAVELYPEHLRLEIDSRNQRTVRGFTRQGSRGQLVGTLDGLERTLAERPYLVGDRLTDADLLLYVFALRLDPERLTLDGHPHVLEHAQRLHADPRIGRTTYPDHLRAGFGFAPAWLA